ncbi:MAG: CoA-binding protein [Nitrososphaeria archaeon]|nr:CoA-binding protein [Nitrososphaeria archaeon]NDB51459.1 CoA-binding protein [Nitrosopumilaceae archaeon]NDB87629.1 CoA-binding protein [Nitrososphaerota archaeon]NDB47133.1 CoA-binding protein [Nitrososphaeria archaeon]NDB63426.1 CoA-binding protein [Nitrosopumilaceae archaeon]
MLCMDRDSHTDDEIRQILSLNKVAVVGMSKNEEKAANYVPKYLISQGYDILPVNPTADVILDRKCHSTLSDISEPIDIVDVFRPSDQVLPVIQEAIKKKPKVIWLQEGIHNEEAEDMARNAGIKVVYNRCMLAEHQRLF